MDVVRPGSRWAIAAALLGGLATAGVAAGELVGQVVCSQCWFEADRSTIAYGTPDDLACAARCAARGVPQALAVREESGFELVRIVGDAPAGEPWRDVVGRFARVSGEIEDAEGGRVIRPVGVELLDEAPWSAGAEPVAPAVLQWTDLRGRRVTLDDYRGRIVVLNFWATWCAPCRKEMPDLARIQRDYGVFGVQVVGAAADAADRRMSVLEHARDGRVNFPVLLGATTEQMQALGLGAALPATVVLDEHGHVVERTDGVIERRRLAARLDELLHQGEADTHGERAAVRHGHHHGGPARGVGKTQASLVPS